MEYGLLEVAMDHPGIDVAETAESYGPSQDQRWVEVLVDCPGTQGIYTYHVPSELEVNPGDILSVPFAAQQLGAIALRWVSQLPDGLEPAAVRPIEDVVSRRFFPPDYWTLLQRVADYYYTPLMQVVRTALPPGLLGRSQRRIRLIPEMIPPGAAEFLSLPARHLLECLQGQKQGNYTWQYLQRQVSGANRGLRDLLKRGWVESYLETPAPVRPKQQQAITLVAMSPSTQLSPKQQEVVEVLRRRGGEMWVQELLQSCHTSSSVVKGLEQKGWVTIQPREILRGDSGYVAPDMPKPLTADQTLALQKIRDLTGYTQALLHGVTGSGKTEVYLQAIAPLLQQGYSALVLVPEIGLTPQLTDRFRARFGSRVQVYHSALSDGERYDTWRQMLTGTPQIVIGTRSAVFAPLPNLGIVILDEEHDGSFKQDQPAPCYHARAIAQWRTELARCPLILGSATPSLESWVMAGQGEGVMDSGVTHRGGGQTVKVPASLRVDASPTMYLSLPQRVHARPMPPIQVVDMRQELQQGNRSIFSRTLGQALQEIQDQPGKQGILFMPRRGYSTFVSCRSCGYVLECPSCDISLTYHQVQVLQDGLLRCHYCGHNQTHPSRCPSCQSPYLKHFGSGTQRVIQELSDHFPELRCIRFDSDTTRAKGSHRALLGRFAQGEADLLVGTQMLTKGIDLPQVTLVGIVAADGLLHLADYRASERAFQTLAQVAGRAGRGEDPGQVILQTYTPEHPVIQAVQQHDYATFVAAELHHRAALHYPPVGQLILLRLSSPDATAVRQTAQAIATSLTPTDPNSSAYRLLGPAPAAIQRIARRYRWQLLLKGETGMLPDIPQLMEVRSLCPPSVSLTIDVDPLNVL